VNNGSLKSQTSVDIYLGLLSNLLSDIQRKLHLDPSDVARDIETVQSRCRSEGIQFLTVTLPKLGKAIDKGLEDGKLTIPREFKCSRRNVGVPEFLQGVLSLIFGSDALQADPCPTAVMAARQVCYLVYKLELPYSDAQSREVIARFEATETELRNLLVKDDDLLDLVRHVLAVVFEGIDPKDILPRHGPGAVATGEHLEEKWVFSRLFNQIHQSYPYYEYFVVGAAREVLDRVEWYRGLTRLETGVAKVVLVPKDSRGPRLISCEPLEYQFIQQGLNRVLVDRLESHRLTRGHVNFHDQTVNSTLALVHSGSTEDDKDVRGMATLDLKDASDRVSLEVVAMCFPKHLARHLLAARSTATTLPDGRVIPLMKFAPMGSALCFSVEAALFWAICVAAVVKGEREAGHFKRNGRFSLSRAVESAAEGVFVYGDDIIVPTNEYDRVVEALTMFGLRVNTEKCYRRGHFRESCGVDAFRGVDVTPTRVSTIWSGSAVDGTAYASYAEYANDFADHGYSNVAEYIRALISGTYGQLPYGTRDSGYPCIVVPSPRLAESLNRDLGIRGRWNVHLQRQEFFVRFLKSRSRPTTLDGWSRCFRNLLGSGGDDPSTVTVPRRTRLLRGWMSV
jgi:hypothetical protein